MIGFLGAESVYILRNGAIDAKKLAATMNRGPAIDPQVVNSIAHLLKESGTVYNNSGFYAKGWLLMWHLLDLNSQQIAWEWLDLPNGNYYAERNTLPNLAAGRTACVEQFTRDIIDHALIFDAIILSPQERAILQQIAAPFPRVRVADDVLRPPTLNTIIPAVYTRVYSGGNIGEIPAINELAGSEIFALMGKIAMRNKEADQMIQGLIRAAIVYHGRNNEMAVDAVQPQEVLQEEVIVQGAAAARNQRGAGRGRGGARVPHGAYLIAVAAGAAAQVPQQADAQQQEQAAEAQEEQEPAEQPAANVQQQQQPPARAEQAAPAARRVWITSTYEMGSMPWPRPMGHNPMWSWVGEEVGKSCLPPSESEVSALYSLLPSQSRHVGRLMAQVMSVGISNVFYSGNISNEDLNLYRQPNVECRARQWLALMTDARGDSDLTDSNVLNPRGDVAPGSEAAEMSANSLNCPMLYKAACGWIARHTGIAISWANFTCDSWNNSNRGGRDLNAANTNWRTLGVGSPRLGSVLSTGFLLPAFPVNYGLCGGPIRISLATEMRLGRCLECTPICVYQILTLSFF